MRFAGYAALFGKRDAGGDVIRKGAFARTLAERKQPIPLFWQHRPDMRIGWVERIAEDAKGLRVVASIDNPDGGAAAALKAGKANGLSFGYRARQYRREAEGRQLAEIDLYEVSLVTNPMQHTARVHMVEGAVEQKFNPYHDPDDGRFTFKPGGGSLAPRSASHRPTVSSHIARARSTPNTAEASASRQLPANSQSSASSRIRPIPRPATSRQNRPNSATNATLRDNRERAVTNRDLENIRRTFGTAPAPRLNLSIVPRPPHRDLTPGDSAASFALRQVGAGTYEQLDENPHAVGRFSPSINGRGSLRCNAMVYDSLYSAGAAPSRMQGGRIPVANEWGNSRVEIGYYPVAAQYEVPPTGISASIARRLREGDVISDGEHVALVTLRFGSPQSVSAVPMWWINRSLNSELPARGGVVRNDWGFRPGQRIVVRRFERTHRSK